MRFRGHFGPGASVVAMVAVALTSVPAWAQAQTQADEEIIVFGKSSSQTTLDIPQTVNVFRQDMIEQIGATRLGDVLRFVPGASSNGSELDAFGDSYLMRGFEADSTINGIRTDRMNHARDSVSVERVEILKGPASVLYGQLQPGAVVNVVTKEPLRDLALQITGEAGRFDFYRGTVDLSVPLTEDGSIATRLIGAYENSNSFIDFWGKDHRFFAPSVVFLPSDNTKILIEGMYSRDQWDAFYNGVPAEGTVLPNPNGPLPRSLHLADPSFDGTVRRTSEINARLEHEFTPDISFRLAATWSDRGSDYQEIFGVLGWETDAADGVLTRALLDSNGSASTWDFHADVGFRFDTGSIGHELTIGAEYGIDKSQGIDRVGLVESLDLYNPVYDFETQPPVLLPLYTNNTRNDVDRLGLFIQERMRITDNLRLIAGLRYSTVDQRQLFSSGGPAALTKVKTNSWTHQVGILYSPVPTVSLFASRSTSFVPVLMNNSDGTPLAPETGTQYEAGAKATFLDGRMNGSISLFHLTRGNVAVSDRDNPSFFLTIGEQTAKGVEISVDGKIAPNWSIYAGYAYTDAKTTKDTQAVGETNREGYRLRGVAKNTFVFNTNYEIVDGALAGFNLGGSVNYVGKRAGDIDETFNLPSYWRVDALAGYKINDRLSLRLNIDNVLNDKIYSVAWSAYEVWPSTPRTYRATIAFAL